MTRVRSALGLLALLALLASASAAAREEAPVAPISTTFDLSHPRPLALASGQVVRLRGEVRTSFDGTIYDAAARYDDGGERLGGVVAIEESGLRVTRRERGLVELEANGAHAPLCAALMLASPCLVPRTVSLAHERLLTESDFVRTLSGELSIELPAPPTPPSPARTFIAMQLAVAFALLGIAGLVVAHRKRRARALSRIADAAREARKAAAGQPDAARLLDQIDTLCAHARILARAERVASKRYEKERARVPNQREGFGAKAAAEIERLAQERDRARRGLEEIVDALRVLALREIAAEGSLEATERALAALDDDLELRREAAAEAAATIK